MEIVEESRVLGSVIYSENACRMHLEQLAHDHIMLSRKLADHCKASPQNVYKSLTDSLQQTDIFVTNNTQHRQRSARN